MTGALVGAMACSDTVSDIGNEFLDDLGFDVTVVDTLTLEISTIRFDSLITDEGRLVLGNGYEDYIGSFRTGSFFNILPADEVSTLVGTDVEYDSITFFFNTDGFFYYDSIGEFNAMLYETSEELEPQEDNRYYNNQNFEVNTDINGDSITIANSFFSVRANDNEIEFRISDDLGTAIFDLYEDEVFVGFDDLEDIILGYYLEFLSNESFFIGIDKSRSGFRIFYQDQDETDIDERDKILTFFIDPANSFHSLSLNENESAVNRIEDVEESLPSDSTDNESYIQSLIGLAFRIDIPNLRSILEDNPNLQIFSAELELEIQEQSISTLTPLPSPLTLQIVGERNEFEETFQNQAFPFIDAEFNRENLYFADVTSFINTELSRSGNENRGLLLIPTFEYSTSVRRVVIQDQEFDSRLVLNVLVNND